MLQPIHEWVAQRYYESLAQQITLAQQQAIIAGQAAAQAQLPQRSALGMAQLFGRERQVSPFSPEAEARARALLLRLLTPEQRKCYEANEFFDVVRDGKKYRIGTFSTVKVYDLEGNLLESWCAYLPNAPMCDTLVANLLLIRDDPEKLRRMANVTKMHPEARPGEWGQYVRPRPGEWVEVDIAVPNRVRGLRANVARMLRRAGYMA